MLVLSRRRNEKIVLSGGIELTVVEIRGDKVRLGLTAPESVIIHRQEVWDAVERERTEGTEK